MVSMEITIYDKKGKPCAYIATDDMDTIWTEPLLVYK